MRDTYTNKLRDYLPNATVAALIEAPEKADYGDLDLFIATDEQLNLVDVASHLGAAGLIMPSTKKITLAVTKSSEKSRKAPLVVYKHSQGKGTGPANTLSTEEYAQLDIEVISTASLDWYSFYSSYGDLAGLIGHIVTQLGFTGMRLDR